MFFYYIGKCRKDYDGGVLLAASGYFYLGFGIKYFLLLICVIAISYIAGILLYRCKKRTFKISILCVSVIVFILLLGYFKYANFLLSGLNMVLNYFTIPFTESTINLVAPIGISFYTFKIIGYLADVYHGAEPECHLGKYALFVAFFPEITSGPIDRSNNLLPQIRKNHVFQYEKVTYGLKQIAWGLFKKIVVADTLSHYVNWIFGDYKSYYGFTLLIISIFYTIQIYCDFSGYSDMAIGIAGMLDVEVKENFRSPYFSESVQEFWRRWHISLSTWFRDYVYIPLGGNRKGIVKKYRNLLLTFLLSGLWHGANWTYILWGGLHGAAQIIEDCIKRKGIKFQNNIAKLVRTILVFLFCNVAWIFFRSETVGQAIHFIVHMFDGITNPIAYVSLAHQQLSIDVFLFCKIVIMIMIVAIFDFFNRDKDVIEIISNQKTTVRWSIYILFVFITFAFLPVIPGNDFLYFQF